MSEQLPQRARVVIIGGGVIGCSVAYHLAHLGWTDVLLLEQGSLSAARPGTQPAWSASCGPPRPARGSSSTPPTSTRASRPRPASGPATASAAASPWPGPRSGWWRCGARPPAPRHTTSTASCSPPEEAHERYPLIRADDLVGAIWLPGDGRANPTDLTQALAKGARMRGVRIVERVRVTDVLTDGRAGQWVRTDQGDVEAEFVVNCAGQWAKAVGELVGVTVPLHSAEHFYVVTEQIDGVHRDLPILRDPDGYTYVKEEVGGLLVGGFEPVAKPWVAPDQIPYPFEFALLEEDWEHFEVLMDSAVHRLPVLAETGIRKFYNGPESFTPDNQFIIGEAPELAGLLRRGRLQLRGDRVGRRCRSGARRVDRRGRADHRPDQRGHPQVLPARRATTTGCAPRG